MIKGGGAALTREKIVADLAERFVCIADESKLVERLGRYPLPVEVIPMAAAQVARRFTSAFGGQAVLRAGVTTDNGNSLLDVHGLSIADRWRWRPKSTSGGRRVRGHLCTPPRQRLPAGHGPGRAQPAVRLISRRGAPRAR